MKFTDNSGQFSDDPLYDFSNTDLYEMIFLNANPDFVDPFKNLFTLGANSSATGNADPQTALLVPLDILGIDRTEDPAIGAYQRIP